MAEEHNAVGSAPDTEEHSEPKQQAKEDEVPSTAANGEKEDPSIECKRNVNITTHYSALQPNDRALYDYYWVVDKAAATTSI